MRNLWHAIVGKKDNGLEQALIIGIYCIGVLICSVYCDSGRCLIFLIGSAVSLALSQVVKKERTVGLIVSSDVCFALYLCVFSMDKGVFNSHNGITAAVLMLKIAFLMCGAFSQLQSYGNSTQSHSGESWMGQIFLHFISLVVSAFTILFAASQFTTPYPKWSSDEFFLSLITEALYYIAWDIASHPASIHMNTNRIRRYEFRLFAFYFMSLAFLFVMNRMDGNSIQLMAIPAASYLVAIPLLMISHWLEFMINSLRKGHDGQKDFCNAYLHKRWFAHQSDLDEIKKLQAELEQIQSKLAYTTDNSLPSKEERVALQEAERSIRAVLYLEYGVNTENPKNTVSSKR